MSAVVAPLLRSYKCRRRFACVLSRLERAREWSRRWYPVGRLRRCRRRVFPYILRDLLLNSSTTLRGRVHLAAMELIYYGNVIFVALLSILTTWALKAVLFSSFISVYDLIFTLK